MSRCLSSTILFTWILPKSYIPDLGKCPQKNIWVELHRHIDHKICKKSVKIQKLNKIRPPPSEETTPIKYKK